MTSGGVFVSAATQAGAGVERGEDIAEMIVRGRAVHIGPKHVAERLRPRQNRQQNQKQDLGERIIHLPA